MSLCQQNYKEYRTKTFPPSGIVLETLMRMIPDRAVLTVLQHEGAWAVELHGEFFGRSRDPDLAKAAAHRRAREMHDAGNPCQVRVSGETGFWAAP